MMDLVENAVAFGYLTIDKVFADGTVENVFTEEKNVITRKSKRHHLSFLYDEMARPDILTSFKVGTGGTMDPEGKRPINPDPTRNNLYAPLNIINNKITITASKDTDAQDYILVVFALTQDEGNDQNISEVGLFKKAGDMFNIKTFRAVPKNESFSLQFSWRIVYA